MAHKDGMCRCLVAHLDKDVNCLPQYVRCSQCGMWIRPENMGDACCDCIDDKPAISKLIDKIIEADKRKFDEFGK